MKPILKQLSYNLLLSSSLIAGGLTSSLANEGNTEQKFAMQKPVSPLIKHFSYAKNFTAIKMLEIADKLYNPIMTKVEQELEFALVYSAAQKGLAEAQFRLANYYIDSNLIVADESEATFWLEEAMEQGHDGAKFIYENLYYAENFDIGC